MLHRYENGKLVHDVLVSVKVIEDKHEEVQKGPREEEIQLAGVEFIEKAATLLVKAAIECIEISKEDAKVLSKVENGNFKVITDGSRFILKWDPYLHSSPEG